MAKALIQHVYEQIRDAAIEWVNRGEPCMEDAAFNGLTSGKGSNFWVRLSRKATIKGVVFKESADRFLQHLEEQGFIGDLVPLKIKISKSNSHYDIEGEEATIGEGREDFIAAYRAKVKDAVDTDPNWDMKIYDTTQGVDTLRIHLMHHTARHHAKILKNLHRIVNEICGPMDPVQATIDVKGPVATVTFSVPKMTESKDQLLAHMAHEIIVGFQYAEEAHYQDQGKRPAYKLKVGNGSGKVSIDMIMENPNPGKTNDFDKARHRLWEYIYEYLSDHILKPRISGSRSVGRYTVSMFLDGLKEELSPNDFALKIAHGIVKAIQAELKRKGAHNTATFEVSQFNNGVPRIEATLNGRSALTRAAVERAMKDVVAHELPDGNMLHLVGKFGGLGTAQGSKRILLAIKPVQPDTSAS